MTPVHLPAINIWSGKPLDYRSSAQTTLSFPGNVTYLILEPRARFELAFPDYKSGASPSMLTGLSPRTAWSECGESNSVNRTGDPMPNQ